MSSALAGPLALPPGQVADLLDWILGGRAATRI
jgi:hypothetical protein